MSKEDLGAVLSVDLNAIVYNWHSLKSVLASGVECGAVVKSNAYGLGEIPVAKALYNAGCKTFFVAYIHEGIVIRQNIGYDATIFVLHGPISSNYDDFVKYSLVPVLNTMEQINHWITFSKNKQEMLYCAIHFDTGMSRLGLSEADRVNLFTTKQNWLKELNILMVMSHLACGEDINNPYNQQQLAIFHSIKEDLNKIVGYSPKYSLSATSGMFLGPKYHFDLVRPGCALYGFYPDSNMDKIIQLKNPITLNVKILQVQLITKGQAVGYDSTFHAQNDGKLATAAIGYADGLCRTLSNKGFGYIDDYKVPMVGNISMDLTTFDVSNVPNEILQKAKYVELIGDHIPLDEFAQEQGIITYEGLTNLGQRYHREYIGENSQNQKGNK